MEQSFSKSKSNTDLSIVSKYGQFRLNFTSVHVHVQEKYLVCIIWEDKPFVVLSNLARFGGTMYSSSLSSFPLLPSL